MYELISLKSDMYLKLVISSLDYSTPDWGSRNVLQKACSNKSSKEPQRLYATRLLAVLVRARTVGIAQWGVDLLVQQIFDPSKTVSAVALEVRLMGIKKKRNLKMYQYLLKLKLSGFNLIQKMLTSYHIYHTLLGP